MSDKQVETPQEIGQGTLQPAETVALPEGNTEDVYASYTQGEDTQQTTDDEAYNMYLDSDDEEAKPNEEPEGGVENTGSDEGAEVPETGTTDDGWQGQYTSPEEMYAELQKVKKSYKHIQPKLTKTAQELSALRKQQGIPKPQATPKPNPVAQPQRSTQSKQPNVFNMISNIVADAVDKNMAPLREKQAETDALASLQSLKQANPTTFDTVLPEATKLLEANSALWDSPNAIEIAFEAALGRHYRDNYAKAVADAKYSKQTMANSKKVGNVQVPKPGGSTANTGNTSKKKDAGAEIANISKRNDISSVFG